MSLRILKESALAQLKAGIRSNLARYVSETPWIEQVLAESHTLETHLELPGDFGLYMPDQTSSYDFENSKRLYLALKNLTPVQAADERLWVYLTHTVGWQYMRRRWNVDERPRDDEKRAEYIRDRYFFMPNRDRALVRNGIARLWTYAYVTYDPERDDPFELTRVLLQKLDIAQQLLERSFSRVPALPRAVTEVVRTYPKTELDLTDRNVFRAIMRDINRVGGVTILDLLSASDIEEIVRRQAKLLAARARRADSTRISLAVDDPGPSAKDAVIA